MAIQHMLTVPTAGRGFVDITSLVADLIDRDAVGSGLVNLFIRHTSASLIIQENASADVQTDLENWMSRHVPDGDPAYKHDEEGPDDMPAHIRAVLTATSITIPVISGRLALGTWQAIYLYEHRHRTHDRQIVVTVLGGDER